MDNHVKVELFSAEDVSDLVEDLEKANEQNLGSALKEKASVVKEGYTGKNCDRQNSLYSRLSREVIEKGFGYLIPNRRNNRKPEIYD